MRWIVFAMALAVSSCTTGEAEKCRAITSDAKNFVAGIVYVRFRASIRTEEQATQVIEAASFHVDSFAESQANLAARVAVPPGEECESIEKLRENESIETAGLDLTAHSD